MSALNISVWHALTLIIGLTALIFSGWKHFFYDRNGDEELDEDGVWIPCFFALWKFKIHYEQIDSIVSISFPKFLFSLQGYMKGLWAVSRWPSRVVVIKRKRPVMFEYVVITPKDAAAFAERLQQRVRETKMLAA